MTALKWERATLWEPREARYGGWRAWDPYWGDPFFDRTEVRTIEIVGLDLQADGGTRTAAVCGAYIALADALALTGDLITAVSHDLHSGGYGGAVPNPANVLCEMLASLHNADGSVAFTPVPANTADASPFGYIVAAFLISYGLFQVPCGLIGDSWVPSGSSPSSICRSRSSTPASSVRSGKRAAPRFCMLSATPSASSSRGPGPSDAPTGASCSPTCCPG